MAPTWTITLADNPSSHLRVVELSGAEEWIDLTVEGWPFGSGPMPSKPTEYQALVQRYEPQIGGLVVTDESDGPEMVVVEAVAGVALSMGTTMRISDRSVVYRFRFVPQHQLWR